jgi:cyclopropane fatty-acyl-phospholipid synthase-like methyltransferase
MSPEMDGDRARLINREAQVGVRYVVDRGFDGDLYSYRNRTLDEVVNDRVLLGGVNILEVGSGVGNFLVEAANRNDWQGKVEGTGLTLPNVQIDIEKTSLPAGVRICFEDIECFDGESMFDVAFARQSLVLRQIQFWRCKGFTGV